MANLQHIPGWLRLECDRHGDVWRRKSGRRHEAGVAAEMHHRARRGRRGWGSHAVEDWAVPARGNRFSVLRRPELKTISMKLWKL